MAKRGYRGKHPHNDMKVSNPSANKYSGKLSKEYKNLKNDKQRYDYIRTHYFYPQSTCTLTFDSAAVAAGKKIVLISAKGKSVTYTAAGSEDLAANEFKRDTSPSGSLIDCINNSAGHAGEIFASLSSHNNVLLTQVEPGPDGNTSVSGSTPMSASGQSGIVSTFGTFSFE